MDTYHKGRVCMSSAQVGHRASEPKVVFWLCVLMLSSSPREVQLFSQFQRLLLDLAAVLEKGLHTPFPSFKVFPIFSVGDSLT